MDRPRPKAPLRSAEALESPSAQGDAPGPGALAALATRARAASPEAKGPLVAALVAQLRAPQASSAAHAEALVALLDGSSLEGLDDGELPVRVVAVQALLGLGYPHALLVAPEDVELLRLHTLPSPRLLFRLAAGGAAAGSFAWLAMTTRAPWTPLSWLTERDVPAALATPLVLGVGLVGLGALWCAVTEALGPAQKLGRFVLGAAGAALALLGGVAATGAFSVAAIGTCVSLSALGALGLFAALLPRGTPR